MRPITENPSTETISTLCPYCGVGCGLEAGIKEGKIVQIKPSLYYPANLGRLCNKGALLAETVQTKDRMTRPLLRRHREAPLAPVSWDDAMDFIAVKFREIIDREGVDALSFYGSGQLMTEDYYLLTKLVKGFIGTNNQDTNSRLCMASAAAGYRGSFGADGPPCSYTDFDAAHCFFIVGANMAHCHPVLFGRLRARKRHVPDAPIIVVDPRKTETAKAADLFLQIKPGTDVALLNGMMATIIEEGLLDTTYIAAHTDGFSQIEEMALRYPPRRAAKITGVAEADIRTAARLYAGSPASLSLWTQGVNQSTAGVAKNNGLINLALATGQIGRPGAGPFSLTGQNNAMGGRESGGLAYLLPGYRQVSEPAHRAEMEEFWGLSSGAISPTPGRSAVEIFDGLCEGTLKSIWIMATNPLVSMPNLNKARRALAQAELVIVSDPFHPTETTQVADVVLPVASWGERDGVTTNSERRVGRLRKATEPPGEALPDWEIIARLAQRLGFGEAFNYTEAREVFAEYTRCTRGTLVDISGVSYDTLGDTGVQWPAPKGQGTERLYTDGRFPTSDGRARFLAHEYIPPSEPSDDAYPYVLTTGRVRDQWHTRTWTGKVAKLLKETPEPYAGVSPVDAQAFDLREGERIRITSRRGEVTLPVKVQETLQPGLLFIPMHWGASAGENISVNLLTNPAFDGLSKQPELKYAAVSISRVVDQPEGQGSQRELVLTVVEAES